MAPYAKHGQFRLTRRARRHSPSASARLRRDSAEPIDTATPTQPIANERATISKPVCARAENTPKHPAGHAAQ